MTPEWRQRRIQLLVLENLERRYFDAFDDFPPDYMLDPEIRRLDTKAGRDRAIANLKAALATFTPLAEAGGVRRWNPAQMIPAESEPN